MRLVEELENRVAVWVGRRLLLFESIVAVGAWFGGACSILEKCNTVVS